MNPKHAIDMAVIKRGLRGIALLLLAMSLTGCIYWLRAYQTYLQMGEFDRYFTVVAADDFSLEFKKPIMYSKDFISLARLYPSENDPTAEGRRFRYWFRKVDSRNQPVKPEIKFYSDLTFNEEDRITSWSFSSLFLQIAPPKFLEVSLRSIGGAEIDEDKRQLRANTDLLEKITAELPRKPAVIAQLGAPLEVRIEERNEVYVYHFLLETHNIEKGYEDRALSEVKLTFDSSTQELIKMAGRFAGLKVSINYRKLLNNADEPVKTL
ncbi:hypothetical protein [Methylobacter sp. BBA5.1]|uniref:hypothetical protein n=1 Tax=Methylobacter sp. BBA5.1 TaxID=1495064 RepID=UPI00055C4EAE|nr:hypothetical protein [Methylobacter sp. BBA5.1]